MTSTTPLKIIRISSRPPDSCPISDAGTKEWPLFRSISSDKTSTLPSKKQTSSSTGEVTIAVNPIVSAKYIVRQVGSKRVIQTKRNEQTNTASETRSLDRNGRETPQKFKYKSTESLNRTEYRPSYTNRMQSCSSLYQPTFDTVGSRCWTKTPFSCFSMDEGLNGTNGFFSLRKHRSSYSCFDALPTAVVQRPRLKVTSEYEQINQTFDGQPRFKSSLFIVPGLNTEKHYYHHTTPRLCQTKACDCCRHARSTGRYSLYEDNSPRRSYYPKVTVREPRWSIPRPVSYHEKYLRTHSTPAIVFQGPGQYIEIRKAGRHFADTTDTVEDILTEQMNSSKPPVRIVQVRSTSVSTEDKLQKDLSTSERCLSPVDLSHSGSDTLTIGMSDTNVTSNATAPEMRHLDSIDEPIIEASKYHLLNDKKSLASKPTTTTNSSDLSAQIRQVNSRVASGIATQLDKFIKSSSQKQNKQRDGQSVSERSPLPNVRNLVRYFSELIEKQTHPPPTEPSSCASPVDTISDYVTSAGFNYSSPNVSPFLLHKESPADRMKRLEAVERLRKRSSAKKPIVEPITY